MTWHDFWKIELQRMPYLRVHTVQMTIKRKAAVESICVRLCIFSLFEGGLEVWDKRRPGKPQLRSPLSWGMTGSLALDAAKVCCCPPPNSTVSRLAL